MMMKQLTATALTTLSLLAVGPSQAAAQSAPLVREIRLGVLAHDVPGLWSGFRRENGVAINGELILEPSLPFLGGHIRPAIGASFAFGDHRPTSIAYLDARWMYEGASGWFVGLGLGAAVHNGNLDPTDVDRKALGGRVLFHVPLEIGRRIDERNSVSVYFDHISNGNTRRYNEGLDSLGVRYGRKF